MSEAQKRKGKSSYGSSDLAVGRVRTPSAAWRALHSQGPLLAAQVLPRSQSMLLPHSSAKNDFCYTSGKALSFHSQPNSMDERSFTWSEVTGCTVQLLNSALQEKPSELLGEYLSSLPLPTVTEPLAELTSCGVNETWIAMILRGMVSGETDTTGSNAIIYCAEDTVLQFLCDQLKRSENVMLKWCSNFQLLLVKLLL